MLTEEIVSAWMEELKVAWVEKDIAKAVSIFSHSKRYFERPFYAASTIEEIEGYWKDLVDYEEIELDYEIYAIKDKRAIIHYRNRFVSIETGKKYELDGVFSVLFDDYLKCEEFRQWWFAR